MSRTAKLLFLASALLLIVLFVLRFIIGGWVSYFWAPLVISALCFAGAVVVDYKFYFEFLTLKTTKSGMNMGLMILLALSSAVAVNYLAHRFDRSFDLTKEKLNSLSEQSQSVLAGLGDEVTFTVLYRGNDDAMLREAARQNLTNYVNASRKIKVRYLDIYERVADARKYFPQEDQVRFAVVAEYGDKKSFVDEGLTEASLTSAIIKVTREKSKTIYFLSGHGEANLNDGSGEGLSALRQGLQEMSFQTGTLTLAAGDRLPDQAQDAVLAIVGPKTAFLDSELEQIRTFAKNGGRILIAIDPGYRHGLANLTKSFGIEFKNNYVMTETLQQIGVATVGAEYNPESEATRRFGLGTLTLFLEASQLSREPTAEPAQNTRELVVTEGQAVLLNDLSRGPVPESAGGHAIVMDSTLEPGGGYVVVAGDSDFLKDRAITQMANRDLALNLFAALGREAELAGIRPKQPRGASLILTTYGRYTVVIAGIALPILLLLASGILWYRRKNL